MIRRYRCAQPPATFGIPLGCPLRTFFFACLQNGKRLKASSDLRIQLNPMTSKQIQALAREHGTPVVIIDHDVIRANYAGFKRHLPRVQAYYAVKANAEPAIVRTLFEAGASFDVA